MSSEESGVGRSAEGMSNGQSCQSGEDISGWRSSEQVENGTPSTSLPYWDSDDDDGGPKPCNLYGSYTWKIEKFSQIKRELRSSAFEAGGYKWYILIYPQGCDVCNHVSLFLCVANHDKLLPGWSHFAQFTIAVVNEDPKKTKHSDTLHRFWKKEHDWGWKKFMELSKVIEDFLEDDTLTIKAQVQVIREKADRPFRCLDRRYRRELVRVYLTNVEQICRRFVEERRNKLVKFLEDKARWLSFCSFWIGIDQSSRRHMSREKTDAILKVMVKQFFIEKEVTSTLVMDSLYSGLKALEDQKKGKKGRAQLLGSEETSAPIVHVEKDMFVLVGDIIPLLERARIELLPPKDELGPQSRKDGNPGEDSEKDFTERDERQLTELGRKTLETFVLSHIFSSKIEVAYQEAIALKRQEELIREEEAAWRAESEQKAKRGMNDKEKKLKKKQTKQKRNRKGKDKGKEEKPGMVLQNKHHLENISHEKKDFVIEQAQQVLEKPDLPEAVSDVSDSVECVTEVLHPDSDDRDVSPINWDTDTSEVHPSTEGSSSVGISPEQNGISVKVGGPVMDDTSSNCSTDSFPSSMIDGSYKGNSFSNHRKQKSASRGNNCQEKFAYGGYDNKMNAQPSIPAIDAGSKAAGSEPETVSLQYKEKQTEQNKVKKEVAVSPKTDVEKHSKEKTILPLSPPRSASCNSSSSALIKTEHKNAAISDPSTKALQSSPPQFDKLTPLTVSYEDTGVSRAEIQKAASLEPAKRPVVPPVPAISRPSSAPIIPAPRPSTPMLSVVHSAPLLARSVSAAGRLGPDSSPATHSYIHQSYRNAIMRSIVNTGSTCLPSSAPHGAESSPPPLPQSASLVCAPVVEHQRFNSNSNSVRPGFTFGMATCDALQKGPQWMENSRRGESRSMSSDRYFFSEIPSFETDKYVNNASQGNFAGSSACTSGRQTLAEEFPHLDIINDLLDDEQASSKTTRTATILQSHSNQTHLLNQQFSYPGEMGLSGDMGSSTNSCRFERSRNYQADGLPRGYNLLGGLMDSRDYNLQAGSLPYVNGQIDGRIPYQQMVGSDVSLLGMRNTELRGYQYHNSDYMNLACGVDGYPLFRPAGRQ